MGLGKILNQSDPIRVMTKALGFERDPLAPNIKMLAQDPLEEIDLGEGTINSPTCISANLGS